MHYRGLGIVGDLSRFRRPCQLSVTDVQQIMKEFNKRRIEIDVLVGRTLLANGLQMYEDSVPRSLRKQGAQCMCNMQKIPTEEVALEELVCIRKDCQGVH